MKVAYNLFKELISQFWANSTKINSGKIIFGEIFLEINIISLNVK